jgi:putative alpha-1,2-mannosidase
MPMWSMNRFQKRLDYAYDDWCIAQMAKMLNKPQDYAEYIKRAQYWKNVYNNQNGFMQAAIMAAWYTPLSLPRSIITIPKATAGSTLF